MIFITLPLTLSSWRGRCGRDRMVVVFTMPMQSVPITTKVVSSNHAQGEVHSIQHCDKVFQ